MTFRTALLAAAALAALTPQGALAQSMPVNGLYIGAAAGANFRLPTTVRGGRETDPEENENNRLGFKATANIGAVGLANIGWGFGNGLRAELEGNYRTNGARRVGQHGEAVTRGEIRGYGGMVNVLFDFAFLNWPVTPYLGIGGGYGYSDWSKVRGLTGDHDPILFGKSAGAWAYQAILGASYGLDSLLPGLSLNLETRYYGTWRTKLRMTSTSTDTEETVDLAGNVHSTTIRQGASAAVKPLGHNVSVLVGLRYAFNSTPAPMPVPAPALPVAPAPAPARSYIVFFDFNSAELNARARDIVTDAVRGMRNLGTTRIEIAGHADRSGAPAYNQRLSLRRAEAVAAEFGRHGVPRNQIGIAAFGETQPLVPTADNVREPQNRRVEIVLR